MLVPLEDSGCESERPRHQRDCAEALSCLHSLGPFVYVARRSESKLVFKGQYAVWFLKTRQEIRWKSQRKKDGPWARRKEQAEQELRVKAERG